MELNEIKGKLNMYKEHKATIYAKYRSYPTYVQKAYVGRVRKETTGVIRMGLNYKELMASKGITTNDNSLPYGVWVVGYENCLIEHKGKYQVRMYPCENAISETKWYLDSMPITKQELLDKGILKPHKSHTDCWNVKLENVIDLM